jgi:NAD(P)-dependent dehydrogenase (short-subunit alcohol dehydrogenase family)
VTAHTGRADRVGQPFGAIASCFDHSPTFLPAQSCPNAFSPTYRSDLVFLASDDSTYITGTELFVDGRMAQV